MRWTSVPCIDQAGVGDTDLRGRDGIEKTCKEQKVSNGTERGQRTSRTQAASADTGSCKADEVRIQHKSAAAGSTLMRSRNTVPGPERMRGE